MSRTSCNVIRDLMVLYEDHVCSEESRQMVEEHIAGCEECRKIYQMTKEELPGISLGEDSGGNGAQDSADEWREIFEHAYKKLVRRITYRHILIVSGVVVLLMILSCVWTEWLRYQVNVVPPEDIQITELYELESGDIYCTFRCKEGFAYVNTSQIKVPEGKRFEEWDDGWQEIYFQYARPFGESAFRRNELSVIFPKKEVWEFQEKNEDGEWTYSGYTHNCAAVYYGRKDKEDKYLVWEEGQDIKPAPEKIEKYVEESGFVLGEDNWYGGAIVLRWDLN